MQQRQALRNVPRLSVDIDLTYLPVADREASVREVDAVMRRIAGSIEIGIRGVRVTRSTLLVRADGVRIKVEVTPVLRGCVFEPVMMSVSPRVEDQFGFAEIQVVSFPDLYAGAIVAAPDRPHPRDLFDVQDLLANEGISDEVRKAFIVYLLSHNRPMAEAHPDAPRQRSGAWGWALYNSADIRRRRPHTDTLWISSPGLRWLTMAWGSC